MDPLKRFMTNPFLVSKKFAIWKLVVIRVIPEAAIIGVPIAIKLKEKNKAYIRAKTTKKLLKF